MRDIIRQWGKIIGNHFGRKDAIRTVIRSPIADTGEAGAMSGTTSSDNSTPPERKAWYIVEQITKRNVLPNASPDAIATIYHTCQICDHIYPVGIKVWKIRSCNYVGAPCPRCKNFQTIDMNELLGNPFEIVSAPLPRAVSAKTY